MTLAESSEMKMHSLLCNPSRSSPNAPAFQTQYAVADPTWDKTLTAIIRKIEWAWREKLRIVKLLIVDCKCLQLNGLWGIRELLPIKL